MSSGNTTVRLSFFILFTCISIVASAQQGNYPIFTSIDSAEVWFDQIVSPKNAAIINGPEYRVPFNGRRTHPFYQSPESDRSFVQYDDDVYPNSDLLYDIYSDILILKSTTSNGSFFIKLDKKLVQAFDIHHHHFKKYNYGTTTEGVYFNVLFEEKDYAVLVRRQKVERIDKRIRDYLQDDHVYILDQGKWIKVTGKGSFAKTINKEQRKELSGFIKTNHIKLAKRKDDDLAKLGAFCYSLKQGKR